jgi:hypothetical protein
MIWRAATIGAAAAVGAYLAVSISDRDIPVSVTDMRPEKPLVKAGEVFRAQYKFIRHRQCHTHVDRFFFTRDDVRFVVQSLDFPPGSLPLGRDMARVPATVPATAKPGPAVYRTVNCYRCNWSHRLWPVCAPPRDIHFTIAE